VRVDHVMLQVQAIDLVQVHWWDYAIPGLMDVMNVLSDLQAEGHIRSIGATNLDTSAVEKITDADISLVSNQVTSSPPPSPPPLPLPPA